MIPHELQEEMQWACEHIEGDSRPKECSRLGVCYEYGYVGANVPEKFFLNYVCHAGALVWIGRPKRSAWASVWEAFKLRRDIDRIKMEGLL